MTRVKAEVVAVLDMMTEYLRRVGGGSNNQYEHLIQVLHFIFVVLFLSTNV